MPTEAQLRDGALRTLIARRMDEGRLPLVLTKTIGVGVGCGGPCVGCGQTITTDQIQYEAFGPNYGAALQLHWGCHVLWQLECVERTRRSKSAGSQDAPQRPKGRQGPGPSGNLKRCFA